MKKYNYELIIYDLDTLDTVQEYCDNLNINYAYAFHNKDLNDDGTPKKDHIHFMIFLPFQKTITAVSKVLGIPLTNINYIDNKVGAVRYLIHLDHKDKYQYDKDIIVYNFNIDPYFNTLKDKSSKEGINVKQLIDFIKQNDYTSIEMLIDYAIDCGIYSDLRRNQNLLLRLIYEKR